MADGKVEYDVRANDSNLQSDINSANTKIKSGAEKGSSAFHEIWVGAMRKIGEEVLSLAKEIAESAVTASIEYESAFAGVKKTVDEVIDENGNVIYSYEEMSEAIRKMSKEIPVSAVEIAVVAEAAGQLGIATEDIVAFADTMVKMGTATNLTSDEAATQLARLANIVGLTADDYSALGSTIVDLGNKSATTEADIVALTMRIAGAGKTLGMSTQDILGISAALSSVGIEAEAGGTAISKLMLNLNSVALSGSKNLESIGTVLEKLTDDGSIELLADYGYDPLTDSIEDAVRALQLWYDASGDNVAAVSGMLGLTKQETKEMVNGAAETINYARALGLTVSEFEKMAQTDPTATIMSFIGALSSASEKGETAASIIDSLGISEVRLRDTLLRTSNSFELLSGSIATANTAWAENTALQNEAEKRYETTESKIQLLKNSLNDTAITVGDELKPTLISLISFATDELIPTLNDVASEVVPKVGTAITNVLPVVTGIIRDTLPKLGGTIKPILGNVGELAGHILALGSKLLPVLTGVLSSASPFLEKIKDISGDLAGSVFPVITNLIERVTPYVTKIADILSGSLTTAANALFGGDSPFRKFLEDSLPLISDTIVYLMERLEDITVVIEDTVLPALTDFLNYISPALSDVAKYAKELVEKLLDIGGDMVIDGLYALSDWLILVKDDAAIALGAIGDLLNALNNPGDGEAWGSLWHKIAYLGIKAFAWLTNSVIDLVNQIPGINVEHVDFQDYIDRLEEDIVEDSIHSGAIKGTVDSSSIPKIDTSIGSTINKNSPYRRAAGESYVMADWSPRWLDRGERVLTAGENQRYTLLGGLAGIESRLSNSYGNGSQSISANITLKGDVEMDGFKVGTVVLRNLDDAAAYTLRG